MTDAAWIDWDDAFDNSGYVEGSQKLPDQWALEAEAARKSLLAAGRANLDQTYGMRDREAFDLFHPDGPAKGTVIFVHGGYWLRFDKSHWSHYASGCLQNGWAVAMPSYPLAPQARISEITAAIARAVVHISKLRAGPLALVGHSAGGHLVTRMLCEGVLPAGLLSRISRVVSVSGVHHLTPLLATKMNEKLRLTEAEAHAESPVDLEPAGATPITFFVGDQERPEFLRQTRMIAERWAAKGVPVRSVYEPGKHHFDVIASLQDPQGRLTQESLG